MRLVSFILFAVAVSATPALAIDPRLNSSKLTQLEAGVNWYDLNQRNLWPEDHADMAVICAASTGVMSFKLKSVAKTDQEQANVETLRAITRVWMEEAAARRGIDMDTSRKEYIVEAWTLMDKLDHDTLNFWTEHCLELTRKALPPSP